MSSNSNHLEQRPFWFKVKAIGDWVPLADLVRAAGLKSHRASAWASRLRDAGARVRQVGEDRGLLFVHRQDVTMLQGILAGIMARRLSRAGEGRQALIEALDDPDFRGLDLCEIMERLALRPDLVAEALSDLAGDDA